MGIGNICSDMRFFFLGLSLNFEIYSSNSTRGFFNKYIYVPSISDNDFRNVGKNSLNVLFLKWRIKENFSPTFLDLLLCPATYFLLRKGKITVFKN